MSLLARFSLFRQLLAGGAVALFVGMLIVGSWISREIEAGIVHRTGIMIAAVVDDYLASGLESLSHGNGLTEEDRHRLNRLLAGTSLSKQIVSIKTWSPDGTILYSSNPSLIGRRFPVKPALAAAFSGEVRSELSDLTREEEAPERELWSALIETYTPLRAGDGGPVVAVTEFYQVADGLLKEIRSARYRSWVMVAVATLAMLAMFALLVRRANTTIVGQQSELTQKVAQLTVLLRQNERLHERVARAAGRAAALNERFLNRISADLHDGAGQALALALMRMESLAEVCRACNAHLGPQKTVVDEFRKLQEALRAALEDLRSISRGLHVPEIEHLTITEAVHRAVRDFERTSNGSVSLAFQNVPDDAPLIEKIALFRLLQESLANGFRHGNGVNQCVTIRGEGETLHVEVSDNGKGFNLETATGNGHLGLQGMRERIEILGGTFHVQTAPGHGTVISAVLPLANKEHEHG